MQLPHVPDQLGGVFEADPNRPPPAPSGAVAIKVRDDTGRIIAYSWVVGERAETLAARAYDWLDTTTPIARLTLIP